MKDATKRKVQLLDFLTAAINEMELSNEEWNIMMYDRTLQKTLKMISALNALHSDETYDKNEKSD